MATTAALRKYITADIKDLYSTDYKANPQSTTYTATTTM